MNIRNVLEGMIAPAAPIGVDSCGGGGGDGPASTCTVGGIPGRNALR